MWFVILSGLIVSIDALFIGVSFGSQKKCRFLHLTIINVVLIALCFLGYGLGVLIGDRVQIELDIFIGVSFILLGAFTILYYFIFERLKSKRLLSKENSDIILENDDNILEANAVNNTDNASTDIVAKLDVKLPNSLVPSKNTIVTGVLMSLEAMFITVGLTLMLDYTTILIPLTVGLAHFAYSAFTFFFAKHLRRLPPAVGPIVSGAALITYGILAFVL